ncbi:3'-5' exonuclease [Spirochaeta isovalerica]|uniref:DNA polymerase III epsilon subunit family exonuclease n=1 Tax=Spirochaeta isovalerica TaxID=150 RepID=A0A841R7Q0_9SPIO|nr:3'-5' exonuclease [Spirochaeta isovalerica]MBB6478999.1 DNA polymerase III epsilon subunit family exonuclease [Spirochaeta isovalerica]
MKMIYKLDFLKSETPDFTVFDLETTGLSNRRDRIVEIGAVRYSGGIITDSMNEVINPGIPIPPSASSIHGIYDRDVIGKPFIEEVLPRFLNLIAGSVLVAHNASFDVGFMRKALGRAEMDVPEIPVLDTIALAKAAWPGRRSYSLQNLAVFLAINVRKAHSAEDDSRVCLELLKKGLEVYRKGSVNE